MSQFTIIVMLFNMFCIQTNCVCCLYYGFTHSLFFSSCTHTQRRRNSTNLITSANICVVRAQTYKIQYCHVVQHEDAGFFKMDKR